MKKKIIVIYPNSFPISGAATNRIIALCLGLVEQGDQTKVIINRPTEKEKSQLNFQQKGVFKGILFEYATKSIIWPENKILRFLYLQIGMILTCYKVIKENRKEKIHILISAATYGYFENLIYRLTSNFIKVKFVHAIDEYPWVLINHNQYSELYRSFYLKYYYRLFDGFIVITKTLLEYYKSISPLRAKFIHIPMTVEFERFNIQVPKPKEDYIAYCGGDKTGTKDGVDILVKAFNIIKDDFPNIKLFIIGNVHQSIYDLVKSLNITNFVKFLGFIERDKIPELLINAKALCLARPNNLQAEGGFPTKLGEYLASGNPVIVTKVGEVSVYLKDKESAYIAKPNDIKDFADKIYEALSAGEMALRVGELGKNIAFENFNYKKYGLALNSYFDDLQKH